MTKKDLPLVSGKTEQLILDIKEAWDKHSWVLSTVIPAMFIIISLKVVWEILKKRTRQ